jgi:superfamily II RNA helicase
MKYDNGEDPKTEIKSKKYKKKRYPKKGRAPRIRASRDAILKDIFAEIGVPEKKPFQPDPFQLKALKAVEEADCLVSVPTGSGKTWIAEKAIERIRKNKGKAWYASPLKALTNSKYVEFSALFGEENVGILTGDRKEKPDASVVVGTTEILRNQLYDAMHRGEDLDTDFVILDEAHFLGDEDRGVVWEEIMIYLPSRIPLLLLSATIGNAHQIADWLASIRERECVVVEENERPVPLVPLFFHSSGTLLPLLAPSEKKDAPSKIYQKVDEYIKKPRYMRHSQNLPPLGEVMEVLKKNDLLPAIFFLKSRLDCNNALDLCMEPQNEARSRFERRGERIAELIRGYPRLARHKQLWHLEHLAVGAHHSGQLPAWKIMIERLMTEGLLDAVFATSTVAAGVNFPARTIVFLNSDRFDGTEFVPLSSTQYHQMTGRAGRRGADNIGFALAIPGKFMDVPLIVELNDAPPSDVLSQIRINFSMALNLLLSHKPEQIKALLEKSFATYLIMKSSRMSKRRQESAKTRLWREFVRHLDFLKKEGFVSEDDRLTDDGMWASQLRVDQPLLIAEGVRNSAFPENDPALLAALIACFVNDRESDDARIKEDVPGRVIKAHNRLITALRPMSKRMAMGGFYPRVLYLQPARTIYAWASGKSWEEVLNISGMAEGDLAMLVMRTADNLRHTEGLINVFPGIAGASREAVEKILREPVIMDMWAAEFTPNDYTPDNEPDNE